MQYTLTDLYNAPPTWLANLHQRLDEAIFAVDKTRLMEWIGALSQDKMRRVMGGIRQVLEGEDLGL